MKSPGQIAYEEFRAERLDINAWDDLSTFSQNAWHRIATNRAEAQLARERQAYILKDKPKGVDKSSET